MTDITIQKYAEQNGFTESWAVEAWPDILKDVLVSEVQGKTIMGVVGLLTKKDVPEIWASSFIHTVLPVLQEQKETIEVTIEEGELFISNTTVETNEDIFDPFNSSELFTVTTKQSPLSDQEMKLAKKFASLYQNCMVANADLESLFKLDKQFIQKLSGRTEAQKHLKKTVTNWIHRNNSGSLIVPAWKQSPQQTFPLQSHQDISNFNDSITGLIQTSPLIPVILRLSALARHLSGEATASRLSTSNVQSAASDFSIDYKKLDQDVTQLLKEMANVYEREEMSVRFMSLTQTYLWNRLINEPSAIAQIVSIPYEKQGKETEYFWHGLPQDEQNRLQVKERLAVINYAREMKSFLELVVLYPNMEAIDWVSYTDGRTGVLEQADKVRLCLEEWTKLKDKVVEPVSMTMPEKERVKVVETYREIAVTFKVGKFSLSKVVPAHIKITGEQYWASEYHIRLKNELIRMWPDNKKAGEFIEALSDDVSSQLRKIQTRDRNVEAIVLELVQRGLRTNSLKALLVDLSIYYPAFDWKYITTGKK